MKGLNGKQRNRKAIEAAEKDRKMRAGEDVKDAASVATRSSYAKAIHDLNPQAIFGD